MPSARRKRESEQTDNLNNETKQILGKLVYEKFKSTCSFQLVHYFTTHTLPNEVPIFHLFSGQLDFQERRKRFQIINILRGDITKVSCECVVLPCDSSLLGSSTMVARSIHQKAGREMIELLFAKRHLIQQVRVGGGVITPGFNLPADWVIHVSGPVFYHYVPNLFKSF